jgi:tetratricopeptide (TPR) repeat protein
MSATLPSATNESAADREARVDAAITEFLLAAEAGHAPPLLEFLARHADIADELREFLQNHSAFRQISASMLGAAAINPTRPQEPMPAETLPRLLGDYELLREIGRGGMGTVYAARRLSDSASVAIKVLHPWLAGDVNSLQRFEREAQTAMRLRHPRIVSVLDAQMTGGTPFLVMELIDGESLDRRLARSLSDAVPLAEWHVISRRLADVADALQHAHEQGVIHRDVKPANLLLAQDGRWLIGDFGLARLAQQPSLTRTGEAVGSPTYMSPEQIASREGAPVDHRTDIYSLGTTLYELLTGRPPFVAESREQLLASIQQDEPISPRRWSADLPRDLETLCLKTLEKQPSCRYATAKELAAELRRFANGQRIVARGPLPTTRLVRWLTRRVLARPRVTILSILTVLALVLLGLASGVRESAMRSQRQQAIDAALVVALTGDLKATEEAIARAEQVGVSAEWLELLRGRVAYHRGDYSAAIQHWASAERTTQPTVAAMSLQATAQLAVGAWENYETLLDRAETLTPTTAEDYLFRGEAEIYFDPRLAERSLTHAVRQRDTPLARLIRAEARANLAFDASDPTTAKAALVDVLIARELLPDHPAALLESLNAHAVASRLALEARRTAESLDELRAAEQDFQSLEAFRELPTVIHNRSLFLLATDREPASFELLRRATTQHHDPLVAYDFSLALFRRGDSASALRVLQERLVEPGSGVRLFGISENKEWIADDAQSRQFRKTEHPTSNAAQLLTADEAFLRVLLLRETSDAVTARAAHDELAQRYQTGLTAYFHPCLLLLLGESDAAMSASRRLRSTGTPPRMRGAFYARLLAFNAGEMTETELLESVNNSRWDRCEALFFAGLRQLAQGDRTVARQRLEQCVATRCAGFLSWDWSHAVLQRWQTDPQWPKWIR